MTDDELKGLGLTDENLATLKNDLAANYVTKTKFDETESAKKAAEGQVAERDKQLSTLKDQAKGNEDLQTKIEELQAANTKQKADYEGQIYQMKVDSALKASLTAAHAKNAAAVKAMLGMDKYELADDGTIKGLDDALAKVKKDNPWAFEEEKKTPSFKFTGFHPGESADGNAKKTEKEAAAETLWNAMHGRF